MLAERIGAAQLAEMSVQGASLAAELREGDLPRVSELAARESGGAERSLPVEIGFRIGPEAFPVIHVRVSGEVLLACQRCFAPVAWPVDVDVDLTAVTSEDEADQLADPFDSILLDEEGALPLRATVEDEILAALPLAPVHADPAACSALIPAKEPVAQVNRPFAGLGSLLGARDQPGGKE